MVDDVLVAMMGQSEGCRRRGWISRDGDATKPALSRREGGQERGGRETPRPRE
jgi:hypothetical protein